MHKNFLNTFWEFTRGVEKDRDSFIQKVLKICKTFKANSLNTPKFDIPSKKTAENLFYKNMREKKKLKGATVSQASAIISRELIKVKASGKKIKK